MAVWMAWSGAAGDPDDGGASAVTSDRNVEA